MIPYGRQSIGWKDVFNVVKVLRSDFLTQGPKVLEFEKKLADYCGAKYAVVVANGTAALQTAYFAAGLKSGDEFITTPMTFAATSNAGLWQGASPKFVDVDSSTGNIDTKLIENALTDKTKVIAPVDYTGRPVDLEAISTIAKKNNLVVVEDACQALGAVYKGKKIGSTSDLTVTSFHPVKSITTGEGGAVFTNSEYYYKRMKMFLTHGITKENFINESPGEWYSEMQVLGMNYRLTDIQCALGISQLEKLDNFVEKRKKIANNYTESFSNLKNIILPPADDVDFKSAWHLYVVRLKGELSNKRTALFKVLRSNGIGVQVHHIPVYYHPYYQALGYKKNICPQAEKFYDASLSLPIFPDISNTQQRKVIEEVVRALAKF